MLPKSDDDPQQKQRKFANGDRYSGGWANGLPEGEGRYDWADGSSYEGGWKAGVKQGVGCYRWVSGARYAGEWRQGCMHGVGAFDAPDGSRYQGGWWEDLKHGLGRKVYANGDVYEGLWARGKADGPGRYQWADGNEYNGDWKAGRMHGQGTFVWASGERFDGEWKDGTEDGVGVFSFADGSTYEGFWQASQKHGVGILRPPPPVSSHRHRRSSSTLPVINSDLNISLNNTTGRLVSKRHVQQDSAAGGPLVSAFAQAAAAGSSGGTAAAAADAKSARPELRSPSSTDSPKDAPSAAAGVSSSSLSAAQQAAAAAAAGGAGETSQQQQQQTDDVIIKDYRDGHLQQQFVLPASAFAAICSSFQAGSDRPAATAAAAGGGGGVPARVGSSVGRSAGSVVTGRAARKQLVTPLGQVLYQDHSAYDLMLQLQLGIRWSVVRGSNLAAPSDSPGSNSRPIQQQQQQLRPSQYLVAVKQPFPRAGSSSTPVHPAADFEWKDYAPAAFKLLRELSGVDQADYISQLCSDQALRLLASPGKSGAMFFLSAGERFMVKTVTKAEGKLLRQVLQQYVEHHQRHPNSLLTRLYGLHRVTAGHGRGKRVRFVVMGNIFCTGLTIHVRYDLKGSTKGRTAGEEAAHPTMTTVLKDCDLCQSFRLEEGWAERLQQQLVADTALLQAAGIMDYSLLLGVHYRGGVGQTKASAPAAAAGPTSGNFVEHSAGVDLHAALTRLQEQLARLQLEPTLAALLLELGRANMLADTATSGRHRHRHSTMTRTPTLVLATRPKRAASSGRPLALAPGATDDIARSLGQSRVTLGINMAATAVQLPEPAVLQQQQRRQQEPSAQQQQQPQTQDVVLYFGIIDILQAFTLRKKLESGVRRVAARAAAISAVAPGYYASRFRGLMSQVFT